MKIRDLVKSFNSNEPQLMQSINGWMTVFWIVMIPLAYYMKWLESVIFVSALSLWALVSGHLAAWQSARVEVEQNKEEQRDTDGRLVRRIIKETEIKAADQVTKQANKRSSSRRGRKKSN